MKKCVICGKEQYAKNMLKRGKEYICSQKWDPKINKWVPDCIDRFEERQRKEREARLEAVFGSVRPSPIIRDYMPCGGGGAIEEP